MINYKKNKEILLKAYLNGLTPTLYKEYMGLINMILQVLRKIPKTKIELAIVQILKNYVGSLDCLNSYVYRSVVYVILKEKLKKDVSFTKFHDKYLLN